MAPPQAIPILGHMEDTSTQVSHLWSPGGCLPMVPLKSHPNLGQMEDTPVQVSHLRSPGGCNIWPRAQGLTSIMAQVITRIVATFPPAFIRVQLE